MSVQELTIDGHGNLARQSKAGLLTASDVYINATQQYSKVMASLEQMKRNTNFLPILGSEDAKKDNATARLISNVVSTVLEIVIGLVFAYLYKSKVVDNIPKLEQKEAPSGEGEDSQGRDFKAGLCSCWSNLHLCGHICCFGACRAAHTWTVAGAMEYWPSIALQVCCFPCMPCIGGCWLRGKIRATLALEPGGFMDCIKWCFCMPCAVGQEAIEIDDESGVTVKCCCNLGNGDLETPLLDQQAEDEMTPEDAP